MLWRRVLAWKPSDDGNIGSVGHLRSSPRRPRPPFSKLTSRSQRQGRSKSDAIPSPSAYVPAVIAHRFCGRTLLDTYAAVRDDWRRIALILDGMRNTAEDFARYRAIRPESLDPFRRAAHLIYLNKTCFRGLYRVNKKGQFNVPYGAYDRRYFDPANLEAFARFLQGVEIRRGDFELALDGCDERDFAYLDPPYYKFGGYSDFNRYTPDQFRAPDHLRLAAVCNELTERGVRWALSNSDTPFVRWLFGGYTQLKIANRREINLNSSNRDIGELLILNY